MHFVVFGIWFVWGGKLKVGWEGEGDDLDKLGGGENIINIYLSVKNHYKK